MSLINTTYWSPLSVFLIFDREVVIAMAGWRGRVRLAGVIYIQFNRTDINVCLIWLYMVHKWLEEEEKMEGKTIFLVYPSKTIMNCRVGKF